MALIAAAALAVGIGAVASCARGAEIGGGGGGFLIAFGDAGNRNDLPIAVSELNVPARVTGRLLVRFHSDRAAGCAVRGLCGYSGTVVWTPAHPAWLEVSGQITRKGTSYSGDLWIDQDNPVTSGGGTTDWDTENPGGGDCADAAYTGSVLDLPVGRGRVQITLAGALPGMFATRCAGPLASDLAHVLPSTTVAFSRLVRGQMTIPLRSDRRFASNGFAGSVSSDLAIALGHPGHWSRQRLKTTSTNHRERQLTIEYRATVMGTIDAAVDGDADAGLCGPLGACAVSGNVTLEPARSGKAEFTAYSSVKHPYAQLLRALREGRPRRGIALGGVVAVPGGGRITASIHAAGGTCRDHTGLPSTDALVNVADGVVRVQLTIGSQYGYTLRTRCPGPFGPQQASLTGRAPASMIDRPTATVELTGDSPFTDDGYTGRLSTSLTIELSHPRIKRVDVTEITSAN